MSSLSQGDLVTQAEHVPMKELQDLQKVSFNSWCSNTAQLSFKYRILQISQPVQNYLQKDGVFAFEGEGDKIFGPPGQWDECDQWSEDASSEQDEDGFQKSQSQFYSQDNMQIDEVKKLKLQIDRCIKELGGKVVPKLNWSAPIDALWANQNQLQCSNSDEVVMLLQCSDRIGHDIDIIQQIQQINPEFQCILVLKKYGNLHQDREFRCFVRDSQLIGISQRQVVQCFCELEEQKQQIQSQIYAFFQQFMKSLGNLLTQFSFDVYVQKQKHKVMLMDLSIIGGSTQPLLFDWDELYGQSSVEGDQKERIQFRLVLQDQAVNINQGQSINYGVPFEFACGSQKLLSDIAEQAQEWWRNNSN